MKSGIFDRLLGELTPAGLVGLFGMLALLILLPFVFSGYIMTIAITVFYLAFIGQAWNLMLGFAGLLSLGHALFVGLGAYTAGYLFAKQGVPPAIGVFAGVLIAVAMGSAIGYLGFRFSISGVYFALLTIAFAEFTRIIIDHVKILGGTEGLFLPVTQESRRGVDLINMRGAPELYYFVILVLCFAALVLCRWLQSGRIGYYWRAIRDNPEAAAAVGVNLFRYRMFAVMISAGLSAVAGVFYAFFYNNLFPEQVFGIERSIEVTLAPIVGGVGTLFGPIFGAIILTPLGELLTSLVEWLQHNDIIDKRVKVDGVKLLFWSIAVASIVLLQPRGLWPFICRILRLTKKPGGQS